MTDLITRLEQAEVGSRELDALVWCAAWPGNTYVPQSEYRGAEIVARDGIRFAVRDIARLTTSLDAITALIGEKLPGQYWAVTEYPDGFVATIGGPFHSQVKGVAMTTAPIALCIAMLRAIKEGADG